MSQNVTLTVSERLKADKSLATLFEILREYGDTPASLWLRGEQELTRTYNEMTRRADDYAACLSSLAHEGGWIGIALDTCHEWPALYWGVLRSGHNALLLDASASDNVIQGLLDEAGCRQIKVRLHRCRDRKRSDAGRSRTIRGDCCECVINVL